MGIADWPHISYETRGGGDPFTIGYKCSIPFYEHSSKDHYRQYQANALRRMQHDVGSMLIDRLMSIGTSTVGIRLEQQDDSIPPYTRELAMRVRVNPVVYEVQHITYPIAVAHHVYFPADWHCWACGSLVDGLRNPRSCPECAAPRGWFSKGGV